MSVLSGRCEREFTLNWLPSWPIGVLLMRSIDLEQTLQRGAFIHRFRNRATVAKPARHQVVGVGVTNWKLSSVALPGAILIS